MAGIGGRNGAMVPIVAPRIGPAVGALGRILPFPFVRQAFSGPLGVGARVFDRYPGDRLFRPAFGIGTVPPVLQKIMIVARMVVRGIEKLLEVGIGDWIFVDEERFDWACLRMMPACLVFPGILHIHADVVIAFDLDSGDSKLKVAARNAHHARREPGRFRSLLQSPPLLRQRVPFVRKTAQRTCATGGSFRSADRRTAAGAWSARTAPKPLASISNARAPMLRFNLAAVP